MNKDKLQIIEKPLKGEDGHKTFSIRIKKDLLLQIEEIVKQSGHTRNELIGILLEYAVAKSEVIKGNKKATY